MFKTHLKAAPMKKLYILAKLVESRLVLNFTYFLFFFFSLSPAAGDDESAVAKNPHCGDQAVHHVKHQLNLRSIFQQLLYPEQMGKPQHPAPPKTSKCKFEIGPFFFVSWTDVYDVENGPCSK